MNKNVNYVEMSYDELKDIKANIMEIMKAKKEEKKESDLETKEAEKFALTEAGRKFAALGITVSCVYKGNDVIGSIVKINENTVTVKLSDIEGNVILNKDGKQVTTWKYFHQIFAV